jgi:hypothetical protein
MPALDEQNFHLLGSVPQVVIFPETQGGLQVLLLLQGQVEMVPNFLKQHFPTEN